MERKKYIKGIRIYPHFENFALHPYAYMYGEIFSTLLRNEHIPSPCYEEIYFSIDQTMEEAKKTIFPEKWFTYTYGVLGMDEYKKKNEKEKNQIIFDVICDGLRLIARKDNLDAVKIEKVISRVKEKGVETEITYDQKDYKNFTLKITYRVILDHTKKLPFYLHIINKKYGKETIILIDKFQLLWVSHSLAYITLKNNEVILRGKKSVQGGWTRNEEELPEEYRFPLETVP